MCFNSLKAKIKTIEKRCISRIGSVLDTTHCFAEHRRAGRMLPFRIHHPTANMMLLKIRYRILQVGITLFLAVIFPALICFPNQSFGGDRLAEAKIPDNLNSEIKYLLDFIQAPPSKLFAPEKTENLLNFAATAKPDAKLYHTDQQFDAASAYYGFDIHKSLKALLQLTYNPDIPGHVFTPSSVRVSYWKEVNGRRQRLPEIWRLLDNLENPIVIRGVEYVENTPDLYTGAYYDYDLDRVICLFKYQGRNAMISLSRQKKISDVGKKGFVLGSDNNWDYLYTDRNGLAKPGLGWVRSYMYDSYAIAVYQQIDPDAPLVRFGIFKWINAGWANMNFVKNKHIYNGLERFGKTFKKILECPSLPPAAKMAESFSWIGNLPDSELKKKTKKCFHELRNRYPNCKIFSKKGFSEIIADDKYLGKMKKEEMQALLSLEQLKSLLNKSAKLDSCTSASVGDKKG